MRQIFHLLLLSVVLGSLPLPAQAQGWPQIFDPFQLRTYNLQMSPENWETIQNDESFDIEVPAAFWMDDEWSIIVGVRRKSGDPLTEVPGFTKVSLKIDINEYDDNLIWHGLNKVSLENGDDQDVVSEGFAWQLHQMASGPEGYGYDPGHGCWARLNINGVYTGVYVHAEQRDKRFLENRYLYYSGETWLYKMGDIGSVELKVGEGDSPTYQELCYTPFRPGAGDCAPLDAPTLAQVLPQWVDMQGMLTLGAVNTFTSNPDELFNHGKNCFFADFLSGRTRMYFPWDLDSVTSGGATAIVPAGSSYAEVLLAVPEFYDLYVQIVGDLLTGPLSLYRQLAFLDQLEPVLTEALEADPNNQIEGSVAGHFDGLREWILSRFEDFEPLIPDETGTPETPALASLAQNSPNPFNPRTHISFQIEQETEFSLRIYDFSGKLVRDLAEGRRGEGSYQEIWDGRDDQGRQLPSGVYFCRLTVDSLLETRKMVLLR